MFFHATMCLLRRLGRKKKKQFAFGLSNRQAAFMAAVMSVIPIVAGMEQKEQNLFKLLFFPLAFRCGFDALLKAGYMPRLSRHGDILAYMIVCFFISHNF